MEQKWIGAGRYHDANNNNNPSIINPERKKQGHHGPQRRIFGNERDSAMHFVFTALDEGGLVSTSKKEEKEEGIACDGELGGEGHNAGGRGACLFVSCSAVTLGDY